MKNLNDHACNVATIKINIKGQNYWKVVSQSYESKAEVISYDSQAAMSLNMQLDIFYF